MNIRQLEERDFDEQTALSEFAFQYVLSEDERKARRRQYRPADYWGAFGERGELLSKLTILPLECRVGGRALRMGGIAGVATWPEARRMNCVTRLLERALVVMKEQGQTISMLHPFSIPFYRKFGWELTIEQKKVEIETAKLAKRKDAPGRMETIPKEGDALKELQDVYEAFASAYQGALVRNAEWWNERIVSKPGRISAWRNDAGAMEAYVFYEVKEGDLTVHDWAALNEEARGALWAFLANHDSMAATIRLQAPTDDATSYLLLDPRGAKQELHSYFMSRIVDAAGFLRQYPFAGGEAKERLTLQLTDEYAPWNRNVLVVEWDEQGRAVVSESAEEAEAGAASTAGNDTAGETAADIRCHIRELSAMLLGSRRPEWLQRCGLLSATSDAVRLLERRIPPRVPYLPDFF
ncbi:GNAT family N-acetyltransferase [Cohnella fermenti]|uniref:GNAT family N-acetyltransferase n=1 Tax=Cohnella fermenti TaxID=2565925 RepID=A0A4S4BVC1_9BACL|nr:GNAT family N-acetyltransferase [Cohnella fermenti]THF79054.1 GNAT family N-acetyltransferase [Cohnella fermenti]